MQICKFAEVRIPASGKSDCVRELTKYRTSFADTIRVLEEFKN
jgi:hypothetical protein